MPLLDDFVHSDMVTALILDTGTQLGLHPLYRLWSGGPDRRHSSCTASHTYYTRGMYYYSASSDCNTLHVDIGHLARWKVTSVHRRCDGSQTCSPSNTMGQVCKCRPDLHRTGLCSYSGECQGSVCHGMSRSVSSLLFGSRVPCLALCHSETSQPMS